MTKIKLIKTNCSKSFLEKCLVCGDTARGLNFNLMTCMACKTFFRKNVYKKPDVNCVLTNNCRIDKITRSFCSACRLKKCLVLGMDPRLIRKISVNNVPVKKMIQKENLQIALPMPRPVNLLQGDRSTLTKNEWTLLSNFIHAYDDQNLHLRLEYSLNHLASLPPKFRMRSSDFQGVIGQFFMAIQPLIERSPDVNSLSIESRRTLIKHNLSTAGAVNGIFTCRELNLYQNAFFWNPSSVTYGSEFMEYCVKNSSHCDPNGNLIKLMLFVLTFSTNCSVVIFDPEESLMSIKCSLDLIHIQNVYVTMLWKYFLYLYGFKEAVIRYSYMVKNLVDIIQMLSLMPKNEGHDSMVEKIVNQTERALIIEDM